MATKDVIDLFNKLSVRAGGGYRTKAAVFPLGDIVHASNAGADTNPPVVQPIKIWICHWNRSSWCTGPLCACCDHEFHFDMTNATPDDLPAKFIVMYPDGAQAEDIGDTLVATVSGVCSGCADRPDAAIVDDAAKHLGGAPGAYKREGA